jgi:hypothetical protein
MGETSLPERPGEAGLDGPDQAGRPVGDHEQGVGQPAAFEVFEEGRTARRVLFRPGGQVQQDFAAFLRDPPGTEHRFAGHPSVQPLRHAVDEQIGHPNSLRSRVAKASYSCQSRSVTWLTAVRLKRLWPSPPRKAASTSRVLRPRANSSTASRSSSAVRPASPARIRDTNGSARSATCGMPYSMAPSAVRSRPRRSHCGTRGRAPPRSRSSPGLGRRSPPPPGLPPRSCGRPAGTARSARHRPPSATPSFSNASNRWCVCSDAGILGSIGEAPLAAGANRRLGFGSEQECIPDPFSSKSRTSPDRPSPSPDQEAILERCLRRRQNFFHTPFHLDQHVVVITYPFVPRGLVWRAGTTQGKKSTMSRRPTSSGSRAWRGGV